MSRATAKSEAHTHRRRVRGTQQPLACLRMLPLSCRLSWRASTRFGVPGEPGEPGDADDFGELGGLMPSQLR